jgi:hypothetical protein
MQKYRAGNCESLHDYNSGGPQKSVHAINEGSQEAKEDIYYTGSHDTNLT